MKARVNGIQLNYAIEGAGPWLAMSHSLACNLQMWDDQVPALAKRFTVLRFDTRGHGQSDAPAGPYTLDMLADDAQALFGAVGARDVHWVGLSMGGMIGQALALKYPRALKSVVLADTTSRYSPDAAPIWAERIEIAQTQGMAALVDSTLGRWFTAPYRAARPERVKPIGEAIRNTPVAGYVGCSHALSKIDFTARLKEIACPALVIVGEQDPSTPPAMAREIQENLPGARLVIIPSAAHLANVEQAEAFTRTLTAFYDEIGV